MSPDPEMQSDTMGHGQNSFLMMDDFGDKIMVCAKSSLKLSVLSNYRAFQFNPWVTFA